MTHPPMPPYVLSLIFIEALCNRLSKKTHWISTLNSVKNKDLRKITSSMMLLLEASSCEERPKGILTLSFAYRFFLGF